jgi:hypothetical protein
MIYTEPRRRSTKSSGRLGDKARPRGSYMDSINVRLILLVGAALLLIGVGLLVYNALGF